MRRGRSVLRMLRLRDATRDVEEELRHHFEETVRELLSRGLTEAEAGREASARFGDVAHYRRELESIDRGMARRVRLQRRREALRDVAVDAVRAVVRSRWLTVAVMATLALGLGVNATMFDIIDRLLLSPPPHVADADRLRRVHVEQWEEWARERRTRGTLSLPEFVAMTEAASLAGGAAWAEQRLTAGHGMDARPLTTVAVSGNYFDVVGARPVLGRFIEPSDDAVSAERVVVLGHAFWQSEYGGATDVLGRTLAAGSATYTIVGVAPKGMTSLRLAPVDVWVPARQVMTQQALEGWGYLTFGGVVRLRDGIDESVAAEQMTGVLRRARAEQAEGSMDDAARVILAPLLEARGPMAVAEVRVAKWLAAVAVIVLLIACINVANLLLARVIRQRREIAVRVALGVSRRRLAGQTLLEGLLLGLLGGAAALLGARWLGTAAGRILLPGVAWAEVGWSSRVVPITVLAACATGVCAAIVPAIHASGRGVANALRGAGTGAAVRTTSRFRTALALVQAALSVMLLVGAGLFVRSFAAAHSTDLGFDMRDVLYADVRYSPGTTTAAERPAILAAALERLRTHPAVEAAALAGTAPLSGTMMLNVTLPDRDSLPVIGSGYHIFQTVAGDYFELLRVRAVRGRTLRADDAWRDARVAVVNETMARALWPDADPIGACIQVRTTDCIQVVGVVPDTKQQGIRQQPAMQYFLSMRDDDGSGTLLVRPRVRGAGAADAIRAAILDTDPRIRMVEVVAARERLDPQLRAWRLGASLFTAFGLLALLVSAIGLYAVMAFDVSQRTREIGVRCALGATRARIAGLVVMRALAVAGAGIVIGAALAAALAPRLRDSLYDVHPHDAVTYAAVAVTLIAVALAAALLPANRAARVDPNIALRAD